MTVSTSQRRVAYVGNGVTTAFSVPFPFPAAGDVRVVRTVAGVESALVLNVDFTVTGAGNPAGGTVTITPPPAVGQTITIRRVVARTQETDYVPNDPFPAESHEAALDKLTMITQEDVDELTRALVVPYDDPQTGGMVLPSAAERAGKALFFGAAGKPTVGDVVGSDGSLRSDLASSIGADLVGTKMGNTVQDDIDAINEALPNEVAAVEAARDAALLSRGVFPNTAAALSDGIVNITALVAGSGGTDGTFDLAFTGGAGTGAAGVFVVDGGALTQVTITNPGINYTSAPTLDFSASTDLTAASAVAVLAARAPVGTYFSTPSSDPDALILYRVDAGPTAVEVTRYPATAALQRLDSLRYEEEQRGNLIEWGAAALPRWVRSTVLADLTFGETNGIGSYTLSHTDNAAAYYSVQRDLDESHIGYHFALEAKTGGGAGLPGRMVIYEIEEAGGQGIFGFTVLATTVVAFPAGDVSESLVYTGTVALNAGTRRIVMAVDLQAASSVTWSRPSLGFGALAGMRKPILNVEKELSEGTWPVGQGFSSDAVTGAFSASSDAVVAAVQWSIGSGGEIEITASQDQMRYWDAVLTLPDFGAWEVSQEATVTGSDLATGVIIGIGAGASRRFYAYLANGFIGVLDNDSAIVSGGVVAGMGYLADQRAAVSITVEGGVGVMVCTSPAGNAHQIALTGVPTGAIAPAWRRATAGKIHSLNRLAISSSVLARLAALEANSGAALTSQLQSFTLLPDSTPARVPSGFTCTGMDRITRGEFAGCWIIADDGRLIEGDGSPLDARVHILTPDFRAIVASYDLGLVSSAQGVAVDTSGAADTFWVCLSNDKTIRHYQMDGTAIPADTFDWDAAGYAGDPNGLAYDTDNAALWVSTVADATVRRIYTDPAASPRLFDTHTLETNLDQLHYDAANELLYYTKGANGADGSVGVYRVATSAIGPAYGPLPRAQAIEGLYVDRGTGDLFIMSDGGFHNTANPALNIGLRYRVPVLT